MKRMRLAVEISPGPGTGRGWSGLEWTSAAYWEEVARTLQRGRFDFVLLSAVGSDGAVLEPRPLLAAMSEASSHVGLCFAAPAGSPGPFYFARQVATLDHVTNGRIGWCIEVPEAGPDGDQTEMAEEFIALCKRLWQSWAPDAIVEDRATGAFADPSKVEFFSHEGTYFRSTGPLSVPHMPQGSPLLIHAGETAEEYGFTARNADVHIAPCGPVHVLQQRARQLADALAAANRPEAEVQLLWKTALNIVSDPVLAVDGEALSGTPDQLADQLIGLLENGGDGFLLKVEGPAQLMDLTNLLVPALQAKGVVPTTYTGAPLREALAS